MLWLLVLCVAGWAHVPPAASPASVTAPAGRPGAQAKLARTSKERVRYWQKRLAAAPRLYPAYAQLSRAYLEEARATHDPAFLAKARQAAQQSMAIQETFEAFQAMVAIENYSHRFESALHWAQRAADASSSGSAHLDPSIASAMVEAHLGLGQLDEARKLLPPDGERPMHFYTAAALGQWLNAAGQHEEAARMFLRAAELARAEKAEDLALWATVASAGALLDGGNCEAARPLLRQSAVGGPTAALRIHDAELASAEHRPADALAAYEWALKLDSDPETERLAFVAAQQAGDAAGAKLHFAAAERGFRRAIEVGEFYSLGGLAQLYVDAGVHLDLATQLSERNSRYKRDAAARKTYAFLHSGAVPASP